MNPLRRRLGLMRTRRISRTQRLPCPLSSSRAATGWTKPRRTPPTTTCAWPTANRVAAGTRIANDNTCTAPAAPLLGHRLRPGPGTRSSWVWLFRGRGRARRQGLRGRRPRGRSELAWLGSLDHGRCGSTNPHGIHPRSSNCHAKDNSSGEVWLAHPGNLNFGSGFRMAKKAAGHTGRREHRNPVRNEQEGGAMPCSGRGRPALTALSSSWGFRASFRDAVAAAPILSIFVIPKIGA